MSKLHVICVTAVPFLTVLLVSGCAETQYSNQNVPRQTLEQQYEQKLKEENEKQAEEEARKNLFIRIKRDADIYGESYRCSESKNDHFRLTFYDGYALSGPDKRGATNYTEVNKYYEEGIYRKWSEENLGFLQDIVLMSKRRVEFNTDTNSYMAALSVQSSDNSFAEGGESLTRYHCIKME